MVRTHVKQTVRKTWLNVIVCFNFVAILVEVTVHQIKCFDVRNIAVTLNQTFWPVDHCIIEDQRMCRAVGKSSSSRKSYFC